jgi:glycerol kinase
MDCSTKGQQRSTHEEGGQDQGYRCERQDMAKYVGALDQGTTSTRFLIVDHQGRVVASHQTEHRQIYPQPGWVEHDPMEIWRAAEETIRTAMNINHVRADDLAAIGVANQRETTIVWNRETGKPYANAIVWQDTRTDAICRELAGGGGIDRFRDRCGLPLSTYFSGPKFRWLLENVPGLRDDAERGSALFGNVDSWLIWNLTGGRRAESTSPMSQCQPHDAHGHPPMQMGRLAVGCHGCPRPMLPVIRPSGDQNLRRDNARWSQEAGSGLRRPRRSA